jgi:hypothetical protein
LASGATYRVLALPATWLADVPLLRRLETLLTGGATVIGPPPYAPAGRLTAAQRQEWRALVAQLWRPDRGIRTEVNLAQALDALRVEPDCRITSLAPDRASDAPVRFLHRRSPEAEIYFFATTSDRPIRFQADLRVGNRLPELWDPVSGSALPAPVFSTDATRTRIDLTLGDAGAVFVVLRQPAPARRVSKLTTAAGAPVVAYDVLLATADRRWVTPRGEPLHLTTNDGRTRTVAPAAAPLAPQVLDGAWAVAFSPPDGRNFSRTLPRLQSWTEGGDELKYFSGAAVYRQEFEVAAEALASGRRAFLDLGAVHDLATVSLNGRTVGTWWAPPFRGDVTALLRPGRNVIEVEVRNRWVNRLMGDDRLPQDIEYQQKLKTGRTWGIIAKFPGWMHDPAQIAARERRTFTTYQTYYKTEHTLPVSGLLGPVTLHFWPVVALEP